MRKTRIQMSYTYGNVRVAVEEVLRRGISEIHMSAYALEWDEEGVVRTEPIFVTGSLRELERFAANLGRGACRVSKWARDCGIVLEGEEEAEAISVMGLRLGTKN